MRTLLTILLFCFTFNSPPLLGQIDSLRLKGEFTGIKDSTYLYLWTFTGGVGQVSDSAMVIQGQFELSYLLPESPAPTYLAGKKFNPRLRFWAENKPT